MDAPRPAVEGTRSVPGCIPTQSVGTIDKDRIDNPSAFIARKKSCCIDPVSLVSLCGRIAMLIQRQ